MLDWPTLNIATIMTAVMVPGTSYHNTTVLYGPDPAVRQEEEELNLQVM